MNTLEKFDDAIRDCEKAIEINPTFVKVNRTLIKPLSGLLQEGTGLERET